MPNTKYQRITVSVAVTATAYAINAKTDTLYKKVEKCWCYAGTSYSTNRNAVFTRPLKINGEEFYPQDFDCFLLFPRVENEDFINQVKGAEAAGSLVEGEITDSAAGFAAYTFTLILKLVKE